MSWDNDGQNNGDGPNNGDDAAPPSTRWVRIPNATRNDGPAPRPEPIQRPPAPPPTWGAGNPNSVAPPSQNTAFYRRESSRARTLGAILVVAILLLLVSAALGLAIHLRNRDGGVGAQDGTGVSGGSGGSGSGASASGGSSGSSGGSGSSGAANGSSGAGKDTADTGRSRPEGAPSKAGKTKTGTKAGVKASKTKTAPTNGRPSGR